MRRSETSSATPSSVTGTVDAALRSVLGFNLGFGFTGDQFFVQLPTSGIQVTNTLRKSGIDIPVNVGMLSAQVHGGGVEMNASNTLTVADSDGILSASELASAQASITRAGRPSVDLPFAATVGTSEEGGAFTVEDSDPSDDQSQAVTLAGSADIQAYSRVSLSAIVEYLKQLAGRLDQVSAPAKMAADLPFANSLKLKEIADFGGTFRTQILNCLVNADGSPIFRNVQELIDRLAAGADGINAGSSGKLCNGFEGFRLVVFVDPPSDLVGGQLPVRLDDGSFALQPLRFDGIEPRALHRQVADHQLAAALPLPRPVVRPDPPPHPLADVPGGVVPDQHEHPLALGGEPLTQPTHEVLGHRTDRVALDEPQSHRSRIVAEQPVAGPRLFAPAPRIRQEPKRSLARPGEEIRLGQASPPRLVREAQHPVGPGRGPLDQFGAGFFSRVLGVGAHQPVLGPLPADTEPDEDPADGLAAQAAGRPALLLANLGRQLAGPETRRLPEVPGRRVSHRAQLVVPFLRPDGVDRLGGLGRGVNAGRPLVGEGVPGVADGLAGTADAQGDRRRPETLLARQEDLTTAKGAGPGGAKARTQGRSLGFG
jgi:hypothetical protein